MKKLYFLLTLFLLGALLPDTVYSSSTYLRVPLISHKMDRTTAVTTFRNWIDDPDSTKNESFILAIRTLNANRPHFNPYSLVLSGVTSETLSSVLHNMIELFDSAEDLSVFEWVIDAITEKISKGGIELVIKSFESVKGSGRFSVYTKEEIVSILRKMIFTSNIDPMRGQLESILGEEQNNIEDAKSDDSGVSVGIKNSIMQERHGKYEQNIKFILERLKLNDIGYLNIVSLIKSQISFLCKEMIRGDTVEERLKDALGDNEKSKFEIKISYIGKTKENTNDTAVIDLRKGIITIADRESTPLGKNVLTLIPEIFGFRIVPPFNKDFRSSIDMSSWFNFVSYRTTKMTEDDIRGCLFYLAEDLHNWVSVSQEAMIKKLKRLQKKKPDTIAIIKEISLQILEQNENAYKKLLENFIEDYIWIRGQLRKNDVQDDKIKFYRLFDTVAESIASGQSRENALSDALQTESATPPLLLINRDIGGDV